jgi:hypothetical protein
MYYIDALFTDMHKYFSALGVVITYLLFFSTHAVNAQQYVDVGKVFYANTPVNQFDTLTNSTRIQEFGIDLNVPVPIKNGHALLFSLYGESVRTDVNPVEPNLTSVYTINPRLGINYKHNDKWTGTYLLLPKLSSDFKAIGVKDFQFGAIALLKYNKTENFSWKFGMYYNGELFGPFFVPLIGFYYLSPSQKFEMNVNLPLSVDANYRASPWLKVGLEFSAFVRSYHLNEPYQGNPDNYLTKATNELFTYLHFGLSENILIKTKIGYSIGRNYRIYDIEDRVTWGLSAFRFNDDRAQLNGDFEDGLLFRAELIYRFRIKADN